MKCEIELSNYPEWMQAKIVEKITDSELLDELAKLDKLKTYIARAVASNKNSSAKTLAYLAKHKNMLVRFEVARNKNASLETLAELAEDEDPGVKCAVASNHNTTAELLYKLEEEFTSIVLMNPNVPEEILLKYKDSEDKHLRRIAKKRIKWLEDSK